MSHAPIEPHTPISPAQIAAAFAAPVAAPPVAPLYLLALSLVAGAMFLLPIIYLALLAGLGYAIYWHLTTNRPGDSFTPIVALFQLIIYLVPAAVGVLMLAFMVKPLIAPRAEEPDPLTLQRHIHPRIFEYIDALCRLMNAPIPSRIDIDEGVNASAGFRGGWWGMLTGRLVLTIGAPLIASMDLRTLTGVIAHEFGHFTQRLAMRLGWIVHRINFWLYRTAYERDAWDGYLEGWWRHRFHWANIFLLPCRLGVWFTRLIFRGLLFVAHAISCYMARQMEYDADAWCCRVCGSATIAPMFDQLLDLHAAESAILPSLSDRWRERRLPDNLPVLLASTSTGIDEGTRNRTREAAEKHRSRFFETHPTNDKRIQAAATLADPGVFALDLPASALFEDFALVGRQVTFNYYQAALGDYVHQAELIPTTLIANQRQSFRADVDATRQFFLDDRLLATVRIDLGHSLPDAPDAQQAKAAARTLREARQRMLDLTAQAITAAEKRAEHWQLELLCNAARGANLVGLKPTPEELKAGLRRSDDLGVRCRELAALSDRMPLELDAFADAALTRITAALQILQIRGIENKLATATAELQAARTMLPVVHELNRARIYIRRMMRDRAAADRLFQAHIKDPRNEKIIKELMELGKRLQPELRDLRGSLSGVPYPFPHATGDLTLGGFVVAFVPHDGREVPDVLQSVADSIDRFHQCYGRALTPLFAAALKVETALGLASQIVVAPKVQTTEIRPARSQ